MGAKHGTLKDLHLMHDPDATTTKDRVEKWMAKYIQHLEEFKKDAPPDWREIEPGTGELPSITEMSHCNSLDDSSHGHGNVDDMNESRQSSFRNGGKVSSQAGVMSRMGTYGSGGMASPSSAVGALDNMRSPIPEEEELRVASKKGFSCFPWRKKKGGAQADGTNGVRAPEGMSSMEALKGNSAHQT